ncbi:hypothetical protein V1512DRAFT_268178 [Lipomyces arxii]|uniref:uncharacterized protein n=1 Tax=Lipomyces arxii TaxID=56418 RepID=UPI0034CD8E73
MASSNSASSLSSSSSSSSSQHNNNNKGPLSLSSASDSPSLSATRAPVVPSPQPSVSRVQKTSPTLTAPPAPSIPIPAGIQLPSQPHGMQLHQHQRQPSIITEDQSDDESDAPTPGESTSPNMSHSSMQHSVGGPMPRRTHMKSRNGCLICKRRKVKCDELRPQCRNCIKHNVVCSYGPSSLSQSSPSPAPAHAVPVPMPAPAPVPVHLARRPTQMLGVSVPVPGILPGLATRYYDTKQPAETSVASALSARSSATTFSTPPAFDTARNNANGNAPNLTAIPSPNTVLGQPIGTEIATQQLALLTNYILNTSKSLSNNFNPRSVYMWTHEVPAMACDFDFMMYSIMALSATHLQYLRNDMSYENIAVYYRHRAIESFRNQIAIDVNDKTPAMLEALIMAGALVSVDAFAYIEQSEYSNNRIISLDRWLPLLLGIKAVVIETDSMNEGHISLHWNPHIHFLPVGERSLLYLTNLIDKRSTELNQRELTHMCERPVRVLEQLITFNDTEFVELGAGLTRYIMTWPFVCSDEFIVKLKNHELVPLAIYVHYLAVISFTKEWWQEQRVKNDVRMICKILGREWEEWLEWPKEYFDFDLWGDD